MTTTINNQAQINQIKLNAQRTRSFMDSRTIASIYDVDFYKAHLEDCIQNPTRGKIAQQQFIVNAIDESEGAWINQQIMNRQPEIKPLLKSLTIQSRLYILEQVKLEITSLKAEDLNWKQ